MPVRRRDSRFEIVNADGVLRVWRDVTGHRTDAGRYAVISSEAGIKGEVLTIYFAGATNEAVSVRVIDSHPTIVDGLVRHQLSLIALDAQVPGSLEAAHPGDMEAE
jgi:hypothetical protein